MIVFYVYVGVCILYTLTLFIIEIAIFEVNTNPTYTTICMGAINIYDDCNKPNNNI